MSHGFEGEDSDERLAELLGIPQDAVDAYVTLDLNQSDDGHPYSYTASFSPDTPADIREAAGAGDGFIVHLSLNSFDSPE